MAEINYTAQADIHAMVEVCFVADENATEAQLRAAAEEAAREEASHVFALTVTDIERDE